MISTPQPPPDAAGYVPSDDEMAALARQLDLVDFAEVAFGAEGFRQLLLPVLALQIPGLAAFSAAMEAGAS